MGSQVALIKCSGYVPEAVEKSVRQSLELIGGIGQFVKPGNKVLLKINLLSAQPPEKAVTTHPAVVRAMVRVIKELGAVPVIGDSPSGAIKGIEHHWTQTGIKDIARQENIELIPFETQPVKTIVLKGRRHIDTLHITQPAFDADVVITLPKLKTHSLVLFTGAIKNMFGCVPGLLKSDYHKKAPHPDDLCRMLVDVFAAVKPRLAVMDGIVGMQGNGPSRGQPINTGVIMVSGDSVALDAVASMILGYRPQEIATTRMAAADGLGEANLAHIKILGDNLEDVIQRHAVLPSNAILRKFPRFLLRFLVDKLLWSKPFVDKTICVGCEMCVKSCPVGAMKMVGKSPKINEAVCINCLCCHELCPEGAIDIKTSWLMRSFSGGRNKQQSKDSHA